MFTNQIGCTVWEKTVKDRAPVYVRHEERALYWENTEKQEVSQSGTGTSRTAKNAALILIPSASVTYVPKPDDRILPGICTDSSPPGTALTVMSVRDFRYSSPKTAHIEVKAE